MDATVPENADHNDDNLIVALEALAKGLYDDVPSGFTPAGNRIRDIALQLQKCGAVTLEQLVAMSVGLNEAVTGAAEITRHIREVDSRSQTIASAAEEMVASVGEISQSTNTAAEGAVNARSIAEQSLSSAGEAIDAMSGIAEAVLGAAGKVDGLAEASSQIGQIVEQIDAIAKQTNLLALNATIEAARAGEAGKGFAVVASEVKNLSRQTSQATTTIRERIDNLRAEMAEIVEAMRKGSDAVENGRNVIEGTGNDIRSMSDEVINVSTSMEEIASIIGEQTTATREMAEGISSIAAMTTETVTQIDVIIDSLADVDEILVTSMDDRLGQQIPDMTIQRAKSDHVIWKKKLAEMVIGRARLNPDELADHHSCRLGKWYDNIDDPAIKNHPSFKAMTKPHEAVHKHGIEAARLYQNGDIDGALRSIAEVAEASKDVLKYLEDLTNR